MSPKKIAGIVLIALGVVVLALRGFSYTKQTHKAELGPFDFAVKEKERVEIPVWVGVAAAAAGLVLLLLPAKRES